MTLMKWFRKNNKKMLAVLVVVLMIFFLLPAGIKGCGEDARTSYSWGTVATLKGKSARITSEMVNQANGDLQLIRSMGIDIMGQNAQVWQGLGISPSVAGIADQLLFQEGQNSAYLRSQLYQMVQRQDDPAERQAVGDDIEQLTKSERGQNSLYYLLLKNEARQAGMTASEEQVAAFIDIHDQIRKYYPIGSIRQVCSSNGVSEAYLRAAIGEFLAVLNYAQAMTMPLGVSEQQLRHQVLDSMVGQSASGTYLAFKEDLLQKKVPEPNLPDKIALFDKYKNNPEGQTSPENPHGFGYQLPDRVKVEFLRVELKPALQEVETRFKALSLRQQEEKVRQYWQQNKENYRQQLPPPPDAKNAEPQYRDPSFDEVAAQAHTDYLQQEVWARAERVLVEAQKASAKTLPPPHSDYAQIAQALTKPELPVTAGAYPYFSYQQLLDDPNLGQASRSDKGRQTETLPAILMNSEPLYKPTESAAPAPTVKIYQDIFPFRTINPMDGVPDAVWMVRLIAFDKARVPVSIYDDGTAGPVEKAPAENPESRLLPVVTKDWRDLRGYELVKKSAQDFLALAKTMPWEAASKKIFADLALDPNTNTLSESTLQMDQQMLQYSLQYARNNPRLLRELTQSAQGIERTREVARQEKPNGLPTLVDVPAALRVLVYRDLKVTPPDSAQYLQRKPLEALSLMQRNQLRLLLTHFNPQKLQARLGYQPAPAEKAAN